MTQMPNIGTNNLERILMEQAARLASLEQSVGKIQCGNTVVTTNASGVGTIVFPRAYISAPIVTLTGGNGESLTTVTPTQGGFTFTAFTQAGALIVGSVRVFWIAIPISA